MKYIFSLVNIYYLIEIFHNLYLVFLFLLKKIIITEFIIIIKKEFNKINKLFL